MNLYVREDCNASSICLHSKILLQLREERAATLEQCAPPCDERIQRTPCHQRTKRGTREGPALAASPMIGGYTISTSGSSREVVSESILLHADLA